MKSAHLAEMEFDPRSVQLGSPKLFPLPERDQQSHLEVLFLSLGDTPPTYEWSLLSTQEPVIFLLSR